MRATGDPAGCLGFESVEVAETKGQFLRAGELVCENDVSPERLVSRREVTPGGGTGVAWIDCGVDVSCIEGNVAVLRAFGLVLLDRGDVEGLRGIWCLGRCGESESCDGGEEQLADDWHRSRLSVECTSETAEALVINTALPGGAAELTFKVCGIPPQPCPHSQLDKMGGTPAGANRGTDQAGKIQAPFETPGSFDQIVLEFRTR